MSSSFPLDGMRVRFAGDSNVGMKRAHNEDSFYLPESERLAIVADGMGGHASGEVTSRMAVDTIVGFFKATMDDTSFISLADRLNLRLSYRGMQDYRAALQAEYDRIGAAFAAQK